MNKIVPYFKNNKFAIACSSSNEYVPYLSVFLQSVKEQANKNKNYDIIVFERLITDKNKELLKKQITQKNISLRFFNPMELIKKFDLKFPPHYALECYFRLASPLFLKEYNKILFTDVDLIFKDDPANLLNVNLEKYPLGACKDLVWGSFMNLPTPFHRDYANDVLKLDNPYQYFNTGVMLLNTNVFNKNNYVEKILEYVSDTQFRILEQDGLNAYFKTNIKYLDTAWNFCVLNERYKEYFRFMPDDFSNQYLLDKKNPKIIHWAGREKPWFSLNMDFANIWWSYARKTPFYEEILQRMLNFYTQKDKQTISEAKNVVNASQTRDVNLLRQEFSQIHFPNINNRFVKEETDLKMLYVTDNLWRFELKKMYFKIKKAFAFGEKYTKYNQKYNTVKTLIREAKKFEKGLLNI